MVKQERAARTRWLLIQAAAEAFVQKGFTRASIAAISRQAGVSNGALHFHFETKDALADAVEQSAAAALRRMLPDGESGDRALQRLVDASHRLMNGLDRDVVVRAGFALSGSPARRRAGLGLRGQWQDWVESVLRDAAADGSLADGVSPADAATVVVAATVGFEVLGTGSRTWIARERLTRFWELVLPRLSRPGVLRELDIRGADPQGDRREKRLP
jgi:AcrR family transcriptional regulator